MGEMIEGGLQRLIERDVQEHSDMPGRLLRVLAPPLDLDWEGASGWADAPIRRPLVPGSRFRIASVTKTFTSAAALRLVEDGLLHLDAPIEAYLPRQYVEVLASGGYATDRITLRHLLTHTSGIYDFSASTYDPAITDGYDQAIAADPKHRWSRLEQVRFAVEHGSPYGAPGEFYAYSDTGACLVGEILEQATRLSLGEAYRALLRLERLGLPHTYLESIDTEPPDLPPLAHQYEGTLDVIELDPSVDLYGGGGLVSTCHDLALFFRALLRGEVFQHSSTLDTMLTRTATPPVQATPTAKIFLEDDPATAGMFIHRTELAGEIFWGHDGWWGTSVFTCPRLDITVATSHNQAHMPPEFDPRAIIGRVVEILTSDRGHSR